MSGSGNMIPTSSTRILPSTSMHAQLRPISPRPPRNTTRTDEAPAARAPLDDEPPGEVAPEPFRDRAALVVAPGVRAPLDAVALAAFAPAPPFDLPDVLADPDALADADALATVTSPPSAVPLPDDFDLRRRPDPDDPDEADPVEPPPAPWRSGNRLPARCGLAESLDDRAGLVVEGLWCGSVGETALAHGEPERPARGLGRYRVGVLVGGLEPVGLEQAAVERGRSLHLPRAIGGEHSTEDGTGPVGGDTDDTHTADGGERQRQRVVPGIDLESFGGLGHDPCGGGDVTGGVLHGDDGGHLAGELQGQIGPDAPT